MTPSGGTHVGTIFRLCAILIVANLATWGWALLAFGAYPMLLGTALLAYGLGLRHAVDADHIAAIDNVTRKLLHDGQRPIAVGLFFALGHSTVVIAAALVVAATADTLQRRFPGLIDAGGILGSGVSALFLFGIAAANAAVLVGLWRRLHRRAHTGAAVAAMPAQRGLLAASLGRALRLISRSWQMYPLGMAFALGFDTASEIGVLGIAASETARGIPVWSILVIPALFTAGMTLVDTTDGILMAGAYGWAFADARRTLLYNLAVTSLSVSVALVVGAIEILGLVAERAGLAGGFWDIVTIAADNLGTVGILVIALFAATWLISVAIGRLKAT
jgi:nickel/cobalt transporter (NiCoT) family protein